MIFLLSPRLLKVFTFMETLILNNEHFFWNLAYLLNWI